MERFITLAVLFLCPALFQAQTCPNRCLDFDGTSDYVQSVASPLTGNANFTVEARFLCTSSGVSFRRLWGLAGPGTRIEILESGGLLRLYRQSNGGGATTVQIYGSSIRDNAWHHIAARRNGGIITIFVDCDSVLQVPLPGTLDITAFRVGNHATTVTGTTFWDGLIDEVRVWNTPRSAAEIEDNCSCGLAGNESGLALYYNFDQPGINPGGVNTGQTTVEDETANNNDGTLFTFVLNGNNSNWVCGDANFGTGCCPADFAYAELGCGNIEFINLTPQTQPPSYSFLWDFGDGITSTDPNPAHFYNAPGPYDVCLTVTDASGAVICETCKPVFFNGDNTPPILACSSVNVSLNQAGTVTITPAMVVDFSADDCGPVDLSISPNQFDCNDACGPNGPVGPHTVVVTATDLSGNTATCTALVTVEDKMAPQMRCRNLNLAIGNDAPAHLFPADVDDGSTDNCGIVSMTLSPDSFNCPLPCPMIQTVVLTATDCSGNIGTCSALVTILDVLEPVIICPPATVINCEDAGNFDIAGFPQVFDNCTPAIFPTFSEIIIQGACPNEFTIERIWTAVDDCGNSASCSQTITVRDTESPVIVCPDNITINGITGPAGCAGFYDVPLVTAQDNCSPSTPASGQMNGATAGPAIAGTVAVLNTGITVFTYTAEDECGNAASCTHTVTVLDCGPPPSCSCGEFTNLTFGVPGGIPKTILCQTSELVPCPVDSTQFIVTGNFSCLGDCQPSDIHWQLTRSSDGALVGSGPIAALPFTITLNGSAMAAPGTYQLVLEGTCGQQACSCSIDLVVQDCTGDEVDLSCGEAVVTCFGDFYNNGNYSCGNQLNPNGMVVAIVDVRDNDDAPRGVNWHGVPKKMLPMGNASDLGQVFGLALDDVGNIYVTASTIYGRFEETCSSDPSIWGPGGPGGVYKINKFTGAISTISLPNMGSGLGNVCYDPTFERLYVTNFDDGAIYLIDVSSGNFVTYGGQPSYNPVLNGNVNSGNQAAGFVPLGERIWGIASNGEKLFFSVWNDDRGRPLAGKQNEIWSVRLDGSGAIIPNSEMLEYYIPDYSTPLGTASWSSPVADLEISEKHDKLLLGQRSLPWDHGTLDNTSFNNSMPQTQDQGYYAHLSYVLEIDFSNSSFKTFYIGNVTAGSSAIRPQGVFHSNSAGGVAYGYGGVDADGKLLSDCDSLIWSTGDALRFSAINNTNPDPMHPGECYNIICDPVISGSCGGTCFPCTVAGPTASSLTGCNDRVYGLAGVPVAGNSGISAQSDYVKRSSIYIDLDNVLHANAIKTEYGDVDVFKCSSCPTYPPVCDSIFAAVKPNGEDGDCCHTLSVNNASPDYFTYVNLCILNGGSLANPPTPAAGWTLQGFSNNNALLQPAGGGYVPVGGSEVASFCLDNLTADEQLIEIKYYDDNFEVICHDSITLHCDACVEATVDSVYCVDWTQYAVDLCLHAGEGLDPAYTYSSATLVPQGGVMFSVPPPGINHPDGSVVVSLPAISPGDTYCGVTVNISGAAAGDNVCFYTIIHDGDIPNGEPELFCCADSSLVCFVLPECDPCDSTITYAEATLASQPGTNDCCWAITVHNPPSYFIGLSTAISTPDWQFSAINNTISSGWSISTNAALTSANWDPNVILGDVVPDGAVLPSFCLEYTGTGTPVMPVACTVSWTAEDQSVCTDVVYLECPDYPPPVDTCVVLETVRLVCEEEGIYTYTFSIHNNTDVHLPSFTAGEITLVQSPAGASFNPGSFPTNIPPGGSATFTTTVTGNAGEDICFYAVMHELNDSNLHLNCCPTEDTLCLTLPPCKQQALCPENLLQDGGFQQNYANNPSSNGDDFTNLSQPWLQYVQSPQHTTGDQCATPNAVHMWGNQVVGEGIFQNVSLTAGNLYRITVCARWQGQGPSDAQVRFMADNVSSSYINCVSPNCKLLGITPVITGSWATYTFNVALSTPGNYSRLIITPWNSSTVNDPNFVSHIRIDDVCIEDIGDVVVNGGGGTIWGSGLPNPTSGALTLAFAREAPVGTQVWLLDMLGRIVRHERIPERQMRHELSLDDLPAGVYHLEVRDAQQRLWNQRIVKE